MPCVHVCYAIYRYDRDDDPEAKLPSLDKPEFMRLLHGLFRHAPREDYEPHTVPLQCPMHSPLHHSVHSAHCGVCTV